MNQILNISEILGTVEVQKRECELLVSASADYTEPSGKLVVTLDATVRHRGAYSDQHPINVNWLPERQVVTESVPIEEAGEVARDIFGSWVRKVRSAAPSLHQPSF